MFPVEMSFSDDSVLMEKMTKIWKWADCQNSGPSTFRYTFRSSGVVFRADFGSEAEAIAFSTQFGGHVVMPAD